jgi:hypothetical protein
MCHFNKWTYSIYTHTHIKKINEREKKKKERKGGGTANFKSIPLAVYWLFKLF